MPVDTIDDEKTGLRDRMRKLRLVADQKQGPDAAMAITRHVLDGMGALGLRPGSILAGYYPIDTEVDVRPVMSRLAERGVICALPAIVEMNAPLTFRRWHPTDAVENGPLGTLQPPADAGEVDPDVLFVPLLAFDDRGYRLGQGAGYYDRTLARLRAERPVVAVGIGFAALARDAVPFADHDQRLDWILTESALRTTDR
jgi:5-formyltetrahydrofolate cyclo-ligase